MSHQPRLRVSSRSRVPLVTAASRVVAMAALLGACAGHHAPAPEPPPLAIEAPTTLPFAGTTMVLSAEQVHRLSPVQWSATPNSLAWVSPDGTLTFLEPGD